MSLCPQKEKNTCVWKRRAKAKVAPFTIILNDPLWGHVLFILTIPDSAGLEVLIPIGGECAREHWTTSYGCCQWTLNSVFRGPLTTVKPKPVSPPWSQAIFSVSWELALLSLKRLIMWEINLFIPSWCMCVITRLDAWTNFGWRVCHISGGDHSREIWGQKTREGEGI